VIAVVEYNYEHNGEIVLPAGARVFGKLSHVTPSGIVGFQFDRVETPDGMVEKIDATAMDLKFGPLKGDVSGRNRGKNFLVRSVTGMGTVAAYIVGGQGTTGFNGPISENSLLRERLADNIGMAGQDHINTLVANQSIAVTVPGNTLTPCPGPHVAGAHRVASLSSGCRDRRTRYRDCDADCGAAHRCFGHEFSTVRNLRAIHQSGG
jgi:hypothetical protein